MTKIFNIKLKKLKSYWKNNEIDDLSLNQSDLP